MKKASIALLSLLFLSAPALHGQGKDADGKEKSDSTPETVRMTIVVTAGDEKKPVDSASVYVRFVEARTLRKDKHIEMNLKTNLSGVCHVPPVPPGKFLIQVIAPGWKTFGEYYEVDQAEKTIKIALVPPPKWY